jgi:LCP family protein required for cell wall assembly
MKPGLIHAIIKTWDDMNEARVEHRKFLLVALIFIGFSLLSLTLQGCRNNNSFSENELLTSADHEATPTPFQSAAQAESDSNTPTATSTLTYAYQSAWGNFSPPSIDPATPIPPPLTGLELSDEILVWILLGTDAEPPFTGRTQAIHLLFIHPRFSKASLVSIPGNLYVYIPGYTMQRLNTAYALGGIETLREALAYNFGVAPSRFVLAHPGDFQWLVDDIGTIDVTVFYPMPQACGGIHAGQVTMDGSLALCYASYLEGMDEVGRMSRQQQLLQVIFRKLTHDGNLTKLPLLYASYEGWVKTDLSLMELMEDIPLALKLADPDRISYYMVGEEQYDLWEVPGYSHAQVFLPDQESIKALIQQAIDDVMIPAPLTNLVQTLEAQLTNAYQATAAITSTSTPTETATPEMTATGPTQTPTPTPTLTPPGYP